MSIHPLRAEELAEIFAVLPNAGSTPDFDASWRPEDPEAFILSACSTLVTIVDTRDERIVQFSHFSVKEYLTSDRIGNSAPVSHFQVLLKPAHTLLARACLGVLLQLDYSIDETKIENFPLVWYAASHWVDHACSEDVSSDIRDGMDRLFDADMPHLAAWLWVYDLDYDGNREHYREVDTAHPEQPDAVPLYYAALCGFCGLVDRLLDAHPQDLNATGGLCGTPLNAAIHKGHLDIALFLLEHGADGEKRGKADQTGLFIAASRGYAEIVRTLIDRGANLNVECEELDSDIPMKLTPLHVAALNGRLEVARVLLEYGANVNHPDSLGKSPLHIASSFSSDDFVQLLLDHGADPSALDDWKETALHHASSCGEPGVIRLLLDLGLDVNARSETASNPFHDGPNDMNLGEWTPLHDAVEIASVEVVQLLLDHSADVNAQDNCHWTALHLAACYGRIDIVNTLLGRGANPHSRTIGGNTPFEIAKNSRLLLRTSHPHRLEIMQLLSKHTGESGCGPQ